MVENIWTIWTEVIHKYVRYFNQYSYFHSTGFHRYVLLILTLLFDMDRL